MGSQTLQKMHGTNLGQAQAHSTLSSMDAIGAKSFSLSVITHAGVTEA